MSKSYRELENEIEELQEELTKKSQEASYVWDRLKEEKDKFNSVYNGKLDEKVNKKFRPTLPPGRLDNLKRAYDKASDPDKKKFLHPICSAVCEVINKALNVHPNAHDFFVPKGDLLLGYELNDSESDFVTKFRATRNENRCNRDCYNKLKEDYIDGIEEDINHFEEEIMCLHDRQGELTRQVKSMNDEEYLDLINEEYYNKSLALDDFLEKYSEFYYHDTECRIAKRPTGGFLTEED
jgi:hypothetical protein